MLNIMRKALTTAVLLISGSIAASAQTRTFEVENHTRYDIKQIYVSSTWSNDWGYDRLGSGTLYPGYYMTLRVYPGWYDVKLVDGDGDACVVRDVDFRSGADWVLNDGLLALCELGTALR